MSRIIGRRRFLAETITAAGLISFPSVVPCSVLGKSTILPSNKIVMGCIGTGGMGTPDLRAFLAKPQVRIVAVCDVDTNHRNQARNIVNKKYDNTDCAAFNDFRDVIARADIDAVSIGTPDYWHAIQAVAAVKAGKDIHCQKPLAYTTAEGRAVCDAVEKYPIIWQTGTQQRSQRHFRRACELVRNGYIGKVHTVEVGLPLWKQICPPQKPEPVPRPFSMVFQYSPEGCGRN